MSNQKENQVLYFLGGINNPKIVSATLNPETNAIEVVKRQSSDIIYGNGSDYPDRVWKEIYDVVDGKITLVKTIEGKHTPLKTIPESITFDEKA